MNSTAQLINHDHSIEFTFDGRRYTGHDGDTVASALYRAGVRIFSRSFKYHRPRGLLCVNGSCPNCLVDVDGSPNVQACVTRLRAGMVIRSQNAWPSLKHDLLSVNDKLDRFLPAGFYYKTFIRPHFMWPVYETVLRHAAGLGVIDPDPDRFQEPYYDKRYHHAEVTVVGGGPAGMAAALASAKQGAKVVLVEENPDLGGHLQYQSSALETQISDFAVGRLQSLTINLQSPISNLQSTTELARTLADAVYAEANIEVLTEATAFGWYEGNMIGVAQGNRLIKLRTSELIVATGQLDRPLVFQNNDLPGVFLGGGLQRLMNLYGVKPGERALVVTASDAGWGVAGDLLDRGVEVVMVVDARPEIPESDVVARVRAAGVSGMRSSTITAAQGKRRVQGATVAQINADGIALPGTEMGLRCDVISLSAAFVPNDALLHQSGCRFSYDSERLEFVPVQYAPGVRGAGHAVGTQGLATILLEGQVAGLEATLSLAGFDDADARDKLESWRGRLEEMRSSLRVQPPISVSAEGKKKFVCLCEDVTQKDIQDAVAEGFDDIETLKRYSTISMGPCQGKMCSANANRLCARETGQSQAAVGRTTSRPPFTPVKLGMLAGRKLEPVRHSPMHGQHLALGAHMMDAGGWQRPEHYGDPHAEVRAVRERVGIIDLSTLGKIELHGPDSVTLLERIYTGRFARMDLGRIRYGVMCTEEGIVFDDGVVCRLAADHYYMTTTTGGLQSVYEWLTWWLTGWRLQAHVTNVTAAHAAVNLAGPHARDVLRRLTHLDVSPDVFPYMHVQQADVAGVPARLLRIGFVGELGYEIHVPAEYGAHVWNALMAAGAEFGIAPFGVEAQRVLRLEKKHIIISQDTDALSDPFGADLEWAVKLDKEDFVGRPSLERIAGRQPRERLVGIEMRDAAVVPAEGEQILENGHMVGRVTSARYSPTLDKSIGLGWVAHKWAYDGATIQVRTRGTLAGATIVCQPFYDPGGKRLRM